MTLNYHIIPFKSAYLEPASKLHQVCFEEFWSLSTLTETIAEPTTLAFIAVQLPQEILIGFTIARLILDEAEILTLAVSSHLRRQGIGKALVETVLNAVCKKGAQHIYLEVANNNTAALKLYSLFKSEKYGERANYYCNNKGLKKSAILLKFKKN
jgi:ribosomal-protein-alanine N-acetyltransferase